MFIISFTDLGWGLDLELHFPMDTMLDSSQVRVHVIELVLYALVVILHQLFELLLVGFFLAPERLGVQLEELAWRLLCYPLT